MSVGLLQTRCKFYSGQRECFALQVMQVPPLCERVRTGESRRSQSVPLAYKLHDFRRHGAKNRTCANAALTAGLC